MKKNLEGYHEFTLKGNICNVTFLRLLGQLLLIVKICFQQHFLWEALFKTPDILGQTSERPPLHPGPGVSVLKAGRVILI